MLILPVSRSHAAAVEALSGERDTHAAAAADLQQQLDAERAALAALKEAHETQIQALGGDAAGLVAAHAAKVFCAWLRLFIWLTPCGSQLEELAAETTALKAAHAAEVGWVWVVKASVADSFSWGYRWRP